MKIAVSSSDELIRVDLFLSQRLKEFSRTNIQKMIDNELVKVNGKLIKKNSILNYSDIIEINLISLTKSNCVIGRLPTVIIIELLILAKTWDA